MQDDISPSENINPNLSDASASSADSSAPSSQPSSTPSKPAEDSAQLAEELAVELASRRAKDLKLPKQPAEPLPKKPHKKLVLIICLVILVLLLAAGIIFFFVFNHDFDQLKSALGLAPATSEEVAPTPTSEPSESSEPAQESKKSEPEPTIFSRLSGEPLASEDEVSAPTFCVQIPNGVDGARPQAGLTEAKVVFEAIAEAGITRFAAIFQNPPAVVGPIRSLRLYYLNWDVPFDCTVVHAGGADDALAAVRSYGTRDLTENYTYMYRSASNYQLNRMWNNLFITGEYLRSYSISKGYLTSDIKGFPRYTPAESLKNKIDLQAVERLRIDTPASGDTSALAAKVTHISFNFGTAPTFNPVFDYDAATNSYLRSYATGVAHEVYDCAGQSGEITPETTCDKKQLSPSVVIAMIVQERKASDNYHEDISSIGAGDAYIFQNGDVITGTWEKSSKDSQIIFRDSAGTEVKLAPGQTWISAIPAYGSVSY